MKTENHYLISETAKLVGVETHVLRYWEEELKLPIRRNELGHRYYTKEDVEQFVEIRKMKEQGLQLKAIRTVLTVPSDTLTPDTLPAEENTGTQESKAARLQMLLYGLISQAIKENNEELTAQIKESVIKELDYQVRIQAEENERRDKEYYKQLDEKLRAYSENRKHTAEKKIKPKFGFRKREKVLS